MEFSWKTAITTEFAAPIVQVIRFKINYSINVLKKNIFPSLGQLTPDQPLPTPTFPPIKTTAANITVTPLPSTIQNGTITPSNIRTPKPLTDNVTVSPLPSTIQNGTITPSNCKTEDGSICIFPFVYQGNKYSSCTNANFGPLFWCPTNDVVNGVYMENSNNYGICRSNCPRQPTPDQPLPTPTFPPIKTTAANITVTPLPSTIQNGTITPSNIRTPKPLTDNVTVSPLPSTIQNGTITPSNCKTEDGSICIFPFVYQGNKYSSCTNANFGPLFWCPTNDVVNGVYMENSNNYGICRSNCPRQPTPDQLTVTPLPSTIQNGTITPSNIRTPKPLTDNVTVSPLPSTIQNGTITPSITVSPLPSTIQNGTITPSNIRTPKPPTDNVTRSLLLTTIEEETIAPNVTERCLTVDDRECQFPIIIGNTSIIYQFLGICKPDCPRLIPMPIAITEDMNSTPDINKTPQFGTPPPNTPFPIQTATSKF
ncbi:unnamed protein product [Lepeophtheirus salmonis]|uniref:(salmon louse) hypothetical protein n=1 Tax=Lepeophtheirus salmonis TaxID=72036 RepID=A0A7R8D4L9_LEPSM|nr:unnamed protein product [Lepeophtheirus salmonis]CAF3027323.1 unnamed protein product [Lepeophtheirus salmonis]